VSGVGQQGDRIAKEAKDGLNDDEPKIQRDTDGKGFPEAGGRMDVHPSMVVLVAVIVTLAMVMIVGMVAVVMGHFDCLLPGVVHPLVTGGSRSDDSYPSIGAAARASGVKVPTTGYYKQIGLVPAQPRTHSNRRRYTDAELRRLAFIRHARELS
jgi:MerR HTH family regulatory protein